MIDPIFAKMVDAVIVRDEGGWVLSGSDTDADQDGGWTYAGVTATLYNAIFNKMNRREMASAISTPSGLAIIKDQINFIYWQEFGKYLNFVYWEESQMVFSMVINLNGKDRALVLQKTANAFLPEQSQLVVDGIFGPKTRNGFWSAFNDSDWDEFNTKFCHQWLLAYADICKRDPFQLPNLAGWINRVFHY